MIDLDIHAEMSRRTLLKVAGGTILGGGAVATGVYYTSQRALAASGLTAEDVSVESANGQLDELTIAPTITVQWENYPSVSRVAVRFRADGPQNNGTVIDWTDQSVSRRRGRGRGGQSSGDMDFDLETAHMLSKHDGPLDASSFNAEGGQEAQNDVTVMLDVRLFDGEGNTIEQRTPILEVTYTVRVTNLESEIAVSGRLNTGAECISTDNSVLSDFECLVK
ncbi:hypothetical protein [Halarchaeum acidiphilum]|nr:hypothetical protein [Halarchaeum acidiphilum]